MPRLLTLIPLSALVLVAGLAAVALRSAAPYEFPGREVPATGVLPSPQMPDTSAHLYGRVLDPGGSGVDQVSVLVVQGDRVLWTYSEEGGTFELTGLQPGVVEVALDHHQYPATILEGVAGATPVDLVLPPRLDPSPTVILPAGVDLVARIEAGPGAELGGYEVALAPSAAPSVPGSGRPRRVRTGPEGGFTFADLTPGEYLVRVLPPDVPGASWPDLLAPLDGPTLRFTHPQDSVSFALVAGEVGGTFHAPKGHSPEGALVQVSPRWVREGAAPDGHRVLAGRTLANGTFLIPHVPPGPYQVELVSGSVTRSAMVDVPARGRADPGF